MADKIGIDEQIRAMEEVVSNHRSYLKMVRRYVLEGERPEEVLADVEKRLPYVEAVLATLKWIKENRAAIIAAKRTLDK